MKYSELPRLLRKHLREKNIKVADLKAQQGHQTSCWLCRLAAKQLGLEK